MTSYRERVLQKAVELMTEFVDEPLTIPQIGSAVGASQRTLRYAFQEGLRTSPKAYLKAIKLKGAHNHLSCGDPDLETVVEIAGRWGFWHMGQFAKDYRHEFGELPSETLGATQGQV